MTKPNERDRFEAWAKASTSHNLVSLRNGRYMDPETACAWRAWQAALTREQPHQEAPGAVALPRSNDGKEQEAFEKWAREHGYVMETHPLHWIFLDPKTYAAREGWRSALEYVAEVALTPPAPVPAGSDGAAAFEVRVKEDGWEGAFDEWRACIDAAIAQEAEREAGSA